MRVRFKWRETRPRVDMGAARRAPDDAHAALGERHPDAAEPPSKAAGRHQPCHERLSASQNSIRGFLSHRLITKKSMAAIFWEWSFRNVRQLSTFLGSDSRLGM